MDWLDIIKDWERTTANAAIYEHADTLLPELNLIRHQAGTAHDHWSSPYKIDGSKPKSPTKEKTVIYAKDNKVREQGDWNGGISIVELIRQNRRYESIYKTYLSLAAELGIPIPQKDTSTTYTKRNNDTSLLNDLDNYFRWNLSNNKSEKAGKVRNYLKKDRGFNTEQITRLGFGFVPQWSNVVRYITVTKGHSKEDLDRVCLVTNEKGYTSVGLHHTLSIPYISAGTIRGFIFRTVEKNISTRYLVNTGLDRKSKFFNIPPVIDKYLCVVEGEMDALTATANGIKPVAAIGGSDITGERINQFRDAVSRGMKTLLFCPDLDTYTNEEGQTLPDYRKRYYTVLKTVMCIKQQDLSFDDIRIICLDEPGDPDDFIKCHGPEAFIKLLEQAQGWWQFLDNEHSRI